MSAVDVRLAAVLIAAIRAYKNCNWLATGTESSVWGRAEDGILQANYPPKHLMAP